MPRDDVEDRPSYAEQKNRLSESVIQVPRIVSYRGVVKSVSEETAKALVWLEEIWPIVDMIDGDEIHKDDWDFIIKLIDRKNPVLEKNDSEFLFMHLEKDASGYTTKGILKAFLRNTVRNSKRDLTNKPLNREIFQMAHEHAVNDQKLTRRYTYEFQMALTKAKDDLNKSKLDLQTINRNYKLINDSIAKGNPYPLPNPQIVYEKHLKEHQNVIDKYVTGSLKKRYEVVKEMQSEAQTQWEIFNSQLSELVELRERDSRCCKIFGCLCPC